MKCKICGGLVRFMEAVTSKGRPVLRGVCPQGHLTQLEVNKNWNVIRKEE